MMTLIANPFTTPCAGFVAIAPNGQVFAFSESPSELIEILLKILPDDAEMYQDVISEGGHAFTFLKYLGNYGMDYVAATPAAMAALGANDPATEYECDTTIGYFRVKGESFENQAVPEGT